MRTIERMVEQEIICNVSHLVATLAGSYTCHHVERQPALKEVDALATQAFELACDVDDWEEAARETGWTWNADAGAFIRGADEVWLIESGDWRELGESAGIDPYQREIFEHWFVTEWFADRLEAKGEKVDKDFAGHCVWARTTTGQGIASDSVVQAIHADLVREYGE